MKNLKQMRLRSGITVAEIVKEMDACGVLGAGKIGKAARLAKELFTDPNYTVFLCLAGALVAGGLRTIIAELIEMKRVDVVVTTGANMVHDMIEALGCKHKIGSFKADDAQLRERNIGRIGDIYIEHKAFKKLESWLYNILEEIPETKRQKISPSDLLFEVGKRIEDKHSILAAATKEEVPIICPGLPDSIAGFQLWMYSQEKKLILDPLGDISKLTEKVFEAKNSGVIILGGGLPKHFTLFANTFRDGVDIAIQVTTDRPEPGGLSGASLEEAISWSKVKSEDRTVTVNCDATIAFPLIIAAATYPI